MKNLLQFKNIVLVLLLSSLLGCAISFRKKQWDLPPKAADEVSVMTFNVENLFDTVHDEGHQDYTYLPASAKQDPKMRKGCEDSSDSAYRRSECLSTDWNEEALNKKLQNLTSVVLDVDGQGPDILMIAEIENLNVLQIWNNNYLQKAGYKTAVLVNGPDKRGINLGLLSRFPVVGTPILHKIPWQPKNDKDKVWMEGSRGIFEVTLKMPNGDPMTFFVAHFPSQANPTYWRQQAATYLVELIKSKGPNTMVIGSGDLNISAEEEDKEKIVKNILSQGGAVSHFIGCKDCPGTHNYRKSWSFLDIQIYSSALQAEGVGSYQVLPNTIDVIRYNELHIRKDKYPNRWDHDRREGVSDHFPIYVRLKQRSEAKNPVVDPVPAKEKKKKKSKN